MQRDNAACLESLERFVDLALVPLIYQGVISMRTQASELSEDNGGSMTTEEVMKELLGEVRNWTQVLLDDEVRRIESKISYLNKLLTALFVMKVKVLSCINMKKNTEDFPLTVPSNHTFIHQVYIHTCKSIRDNPNALNGMDISVLEPIIVNSIRCAEFDCLKWNDLLEWGLGDISPNEVLNEMIQDNDIKPTDEITSSDEPIAANSDELSSLANMDKVADDRSEDNEDNNEDEDSLDHLNDESKKITDNDETVNGEGTSETNEDDPDKLEQPSFLDDDNDDDKENQEGERSSSPSFF